MKKCKEVFDGVRCEREYNHEGFHFCSFSWDVEKR
jgi:hypothetical protein